MSAYETPDPMRMLYSKSKNHRKIFRVVYKYYSSKKKSIQISFYSIYENDGLLFYNLVQRETTFLLTFLLWQLELNLHYDTNLYYFISKAQSIYYYSEIESHPIVSKFEHRCVRRLLFCKWYLYIIIIVKERRGVLLSLQ